MGVKGLWRLINNCGVPVALETLENKTLAVDVSIWLHQAVRGFRGFGGGSLANAHLLTLFHRICKLLFYKIRPIFVFDGSVPQLKRQTLSARRLRREAAAGKAQKVRDRLLANILRSQAVRKALGKKGPGPTLHHVSKPVKTTKDLYELPPLTDPLDSEEKSHLSDSNDKENSITDEVGKGNIHNFELESKEFKSLPLQIQHEILTDLQVTRKENSWHSINEMPQEQNSFSSFQMDRLLKRFKFQQTVDEVRSSIQKIHSAEIEAQLFGELEKHVSLTSRIISEDSAHSVLIKKVNESSKAPSPLKEDLLQVRKKLNDKMVSKQDFLTELAKQGIVSSSCSKSKRDFDTSFSEGDESSDEELYSPSKKKNKQDEDAFLQVIDHVLDDNELTQEEILSVIKQTQMEVQNESSEKNGSICSRKTEYLGNLDKPTTSAKAPGKAYSSDDESSTDDDDFIDVPITDESLAISESEQIPEKNVLSVMPLGNQTSEPISSQPAHETQSNSNIDKVLGAKTNSLYLKIVQQKLDDIVHTSGTKSVKDTRKTYTTNSEKESSKPNSLVSSPVKKGVTIDLDLICKPAASNGEDIFKDVFSKSLHQDHKKELSIKKPFGVLNSNNDFSKVGSMGTTVTNSTHNEAIKTNIDVTSSSLVLPASEITDELKQKLEELIKIEVNKIIQNSGSTLASAVKPYEVSEAVTLKDKINDKTSTIALNLNDSQNCNKSSNIESELTTNITVKSNSDELKTLTSSDSARETELKHTIAHSSSLDKEIEANQSSPLRSNYASQKMQSEFSSLSSVPAKDDNLEFSVSNEDGNENSSNSDTFISEIEHPLKYSVAELKNMEVEIEKEQKELIKNVQSADRVAADLSDQVYGEAQELLRIFGLPYIVAPMEAEAQCAFLDEAGLSHGTITDDSDIFLFGGRNVYKNFFNHSKHVECFKSNNINSVIGLDREKMITLALLTGSDYTVGIESVGAVLGMEILSEFPGTGVECLKNLKKWWTVASKNASGIQPSKAKQRLAQLYFPESFPNPNIFEAYLNPEVDDSKEKFSWKLPEMDDLRTFAAEKFGWNQSKTDEIIIPVFKRLGIKENQTRIDSFFNNISLLKDPQTKSKRLQEAISKAKGELYPSSNSNISSKISLNPNRRKTTRKTLLVDPSEGTYTTTEMSRNLNKTVKRGRKKNNPTDIPEEEKPKGKIKTSVSPGVSTTEITPGEDPPQTKEEKKSLMFKKLLEKEKILQCEMDREEMNKRKIFAAQVFSKKKLKGKTNENK